MKNLLTNVFLTFIWLALTMKFSIYNFMFGFVVGYLVLWFVNRKNKGDKYFTILPEFLSKRGKYFTILPKFLSYMFLFIKEVIKGSIKIGYDIITPKHNMRPAILAIPLTAKTDLEITLLANSITLTPGTMSLAVSEDKTTLYVYNVYVDDPEKSINNIKNGLEKKLLEVLR